MGVCLSCRRGDRKTLEKRRYRQSVVPLHVCLGECDKRVWRAETPQAVTSALRPKRALTMANTISNLKNPLRNIVSKSRKRYTQDGFDLDLTYITEKVIAMGFPAEKLEGVYRNHIDDVSKFLEQKHKDHYRIYNLCSERSYDTCKFHERVVKFAFDDHNPPKIELIQSFCEDVHKWLSEDPQNVATVHCKAGKGRTGTMICCYLLYSGQFTTADDALTYYGTKRTHDKKGVTIPSQRRYVEYYAELIRSRLVYRACTIQVRAIVMRPPPSHPAMHHTLTLTVSCPAKKFTLGNAEVRKGDAAVTINMDKCIPLFGDVKVEVYAKFMMRKEKLYHFWFNTFFVTNEINAERIPPIDEGSTLKTYKIVFDKWQLDDAHKDKQNKFFSSDFRVELIVESVNESPYCRGLSEAATASPSASPPASPPASDDEDEHWDSESRGGDEPVASYRQLNNDTGLHSP